MLLKNCRFVITQDPKRRVLEHVDILIDEDKIAYIDKHLPDENEEIIDCSQKIVMPGLINTHAHNGMMLLRGACDDEELKEWLDQVIPRELAQTNSQFEQSAEIALKEMIRSGTTTFVDFYWPVQPMLNQLQKYNLRAVLMPAMSDAFEHQTKDFNEILKLMTKKQHLVSWGIAAHSIYGCSEQLLQKIKEFSKAHNIPKSIHVAETRKERFEVKNKHDLLPIQYLEKMGWLDQYTLLIHSIWITKGEIRTIAKHNVKVSHCPVSNMKLASGGVMPLPEMIQENVTVSLGTDSVASNNSLDMFEEMKVTGLLHKHHRWDPTTAPVQKILDMATIDGAKSINKEKIIGSLELGKQADIITIDLSAPKMQPTTKENVLSNIIYSANGNDVVDTIVAGKVLMENKELKD